jgi:DNA-binding NarL/FixJ family response regulator
VEALSTTSHCAETPDDVLTWARHGQRIVLLSLIVEEDWELLGQLRHTAAAVVALIDERPTVPEPVRAGVRAVRAGAASLLPRSVSAPMLIRTLEATAEGQGVLPGDVVSALVGTTSTLTPPGELTTEQLSWLRVLAAGSTVAQLAGLAGYSERAMFRLLKSMYKEMAVNSRVQAILRAREQGWL